MIRMDKKQQILHLYRVEGKSQRQISREVHVSRKTIRKYLRECEQAIANTPAEGLDDYLSQKPCRKSQHRERIVMTDAVCSIIDGWLIENRHRRMSNMRKQCVNLQGIHRDLIEKGFKVSYSSVCKYVWRKNHTKSAKPKEAYIKQYYNPGEECEFDWGEVKLRIKGQTTSFMMAVFALCHSEGRWAYLFSHQDNLAFMESHRNFFRDVNGVPHTMVYDNMRVAVRFEEDGKKPTDSLQRMATFYGYDFRFCNTRAGWEKGHVERSVDFVRKRAFTTHIDFQTLHEAQAWLNRICGQINQEAGSIATQDKQAAIKADLDALKPYRGEIGCFEIDDYSVDKLSTITVRQIHYSVPDDMVGKKVLVKLYSEKLRIYTDNAEHTLLAEHERSYKKGDWVLDINHYLTTLSHKPGAIEGSIVMRKMPKAMQELYRVHFQSNGKDFIKLLRFSKENGYAYNDILQAAAVVRERGAHHLNADQLQVAMQMRNAPEIVYQEEQKTDQFYELELGAEDVLTQLDGIMNATECIHSQPELSGALKTQKITHY